MTIDDFLSKLQGVTDDGKGGWIQSTSLELQTKA